MIHYLIYVSSAKELFTNADFSDILFTSRFNNKLKDITGILLYHEGNIIQVLEGTEESLVNLYDKIKTDTRHNNIIAMISGVSAQRSFADWPMAFKMLTNAEWISCSTQLQSNPSTLIFHIKNIKLDVETMVNSFITSPKFSRFRISA